MKKKPSWDVEETEGFVNILAWDGLYYKIWNEGTNLQECANVLAKIRFDINTLLVYIMRNQQLWKDIPNWKILHTFDVHIPCWKHLYNYLITTNDSYEKINQNIINSCIHFNCLFIYQEMTPNNIGLIGINKPREPFEYKFINGENVEIAKHRIIMLTLRDKNWKLKDYKTTLKLAIHELTHSTCNDTRWKEDNHKHPYYLYHGKMTKWAEDCGILKVFYLF